MRDRSLCLEAGGALPQPQVYFRPMPASLCVCQPLSWILLHPQSKPRSRAQISCHGRVVSHVIPKRQECKESLQHLRSLPCVLYLAAAKSPWLLPAPACASLSRKAAGQQTRCVLPRLLLCSRLKLLISKSLFGWLVRILESDIAAICDQSTVPRKGQ